MPPDSNSGELSLPGDGEAPQTVNVQWSRDSRAMALYATPLVGLMTALTTVKQVRGTLPSTVHLHPAMVEMIGGSEYHLRSILEARALDLAVRPELDQDALYFQFVHPAGLVRVGFRTGAPTDEEARLLRFGELTAYELAVDHGLVPEAMARARES